VGTDRFDLLTLYRGKMLLLFVVLAVLSAAVLLVYYVKRQDRDLIEDNPSYNLSAENFRPLFAPTDEEMREFERAESAKREAAALDEAERAETAKEDEIWRLQVEWKTFPDKQKTIDLLYAASQTGDGNLFSDVSDQILQVFRETGIGGLSPNDLAELFDSHYRLLPQVERSSGALFRLKQEIAELRLQ
jgi:hypothetical protein